MGKPSPTSLTSKFTARTAYEKYIHANRYLSTFLFMVFLKTPLK